MVTPIPYQKGVNPAGAASDEAVNETGAVSVDMHGTHARLWRGCHQWGWQGRALGRCATQRLGCWALHPVLTVSELMPQVTPPSTAVPQPAAALRAAPAAVAAAAAAARADTATLVVVVATGGLHYQQPPLRVRQRLRRSRCLWHRCSSGQRH